jgi:hypothetical protein
VNPSSTTALPGEYLLFGGGLSNLHVMEQEIRVDVLL